MFLPQTDNRKLKAAKDKKENVRQKPTNRNLQAEENESQKQKKEKMKIKVLLFCIVSNLHYLCHLMRHARTIILTVMAFVSLQLFGISADKQRSALLGSVFAYPQSVDTTVSDTTSFSYIKYRLSTDRRNFILLAVPTMWTVAHSGERHHVGEAYDRIEMQKDRIVKVTRMLQRSTVPHNRKTLPTLVKYLTPNVYGQTLISDFILSPFNRHNRRFYRYRTISFFDGTTTITFRPKVKSTQLVSGMATVNTRTGQILTATFNGEYDMINFSLSVKMGTKGVSSLLPQQCALDAQFKFIGNKISSRYESTFGLPKLLADSTTNANDTLLLDRVRPYPLTPGDERIFAQHEACARKASNDTTANKRERDKAKKMWDAVGETMLGRISSDFGTEKRGSLRINPLLNPLYFGYSGKRGFTYKFDVRMSYVFNDLQRIQMRFKSGYSFKQRQFYFTIPAVFYLNYKKNRYIEVEFGNGNHITNSLVADAIKSEKGDTINWDRLQLDYFRDMELDMKLHYDFSPKLGIEAGLVFHRRTAIDRQSFAAVGKSPHFVSSAPHLGIEYRPLGYSGPIIAADYERSIKGLFGSTIEYERYEFDAQYKRPLPSLSSLQMRLGTGFYTHKGKEWYFLDYTNFRENNIPGGWNDSWANSFELLGRNWYNVSKYYVRANLTYESPILLAAWIPYVGRYIEKERIYINTLSVSRLHPYIEYGYGICTRLFSTGLFVGQKNGRFDGFGVRFGLELFRQW